MTHEEMKLKLKELDKAIERCEKGKSEAKSDFTYWGFEGEQQRLIKEKSQLKKDIYYSDLSLALDEYLDSNDFGANHLKTELLKILEEHKKLSMS